jgi:hypothetical protein
MTQRLRNLLARAEALNAMSPMGAEAAMRLLIPLLGAGENIGAATYPSELLARAKRCGLFLRQASSEVEGDPNAKPHDWGCSPELIARARRCGEFLRQTMDMEEGTPPTAEVAS